MGGDFLFECDGCRRTYHDSCGGYRKNALMEDLEWSGSPIHLYAYCKYCLEGLPFKRGDIINQQDEIRAMQKFFTENSLEWRWEPLPQDGQCALFGIWQQHCWRQFPKLEDMFRECALAALEALNKNALEERSNRVLLQGPFKELARHPVNWRQLWRKVEMQYVWLGLTQTVCADLRIELYTMDTRSEGVVLLRRMQAFPEEEEEEDASSRSVTVRLVQRNRVIAAHFDLLHKLEEVQRGESPDRKRCREASAMPPVQALPSEPWPVGQDLWAEMSDPSFPFYEDTIHPVRVVEVLDGGRSYQCKLSAFDDENSTDVWQAELLHLHGHEPGEPGANAVLEAGHNVHVRLRNRRVGSSR